MERISWVIIQTEVTTQNQIIEIDRKLPPHLLRCEGIFLSVVDYLETANTLVNHIGHLKSLSLNSRKFIPFSQHVGYNRDKAVSKARRLEFAMLDTIDDNSQLYALYQDAGTALDDTDTFLPYKLNIYLKCIKND